MEQSGQSEYDSDVSAWPMGGAGQGQAENLAGAMERNGEARLEQLAPHQQPPEGPHCERVLEKDSRPAFEKGARVISPRFGRGAITGASGYGDMLTYTIRFECGEKRIVAKYGMLERDGGDSLIDS
jgi:hypothetical protein